MATAFPLVLGIVVFDVVVNYTHTLARSLTLYQFHIYMSQLAKYRL